VTGFGSTPAAEAPWARRPLPDLLAEHGLAGETEAPFPNNGWSGAELTRLVRDDGAAFILKRTSWAMDWIARSTRDHALREAVVAADPIPFPKPLSNAYLGAAIDDGRAAILMPDLSAELLPWDEDAGAIDVATLDRVLEAVSALHALPWAELRARPEGLRWPWCPLRERIELLTPTSARRYEDGGLSIGRRFLEGWAAFERLAPAGAVEVIARLGRDSGPLLGALGRLPSTGLHGDLKLANVALPPDGSVALIDWQMTAFAPLAVDLGWFLVSNVSQLPLDPEAVFERYLELAGASSAVGDAAAQLHLTILVGLLLRGWRKGLDAEAGLTLPTGQAAADDLRWWSERAMIAAHRRL
jgi:hypothetical protein